MRAYKSSVTTLSASAASHELAQVWPSEQIDAWMNETLAGTSELDDTKHRAETVWSRWAEVVNHVPTAMRRNMVRQIDAKLQSHNCPSLRELVATASFSEPHSDPFHEESKSSGWPDLTAEQQNNFQGRFVARKSQRP
eukprot:gnl/MRDRNA2_/MRDRNA2_390584_c0_seq1.p1 gnl/MRDRNA2_/MRDRNA2_390584_c0~~gnl/MRDRNA2_/MRDRNA2_390584_c0_seq1.p1  ORF type:complete len:138 (+),score=13.77 gnl/MRDRNA2_/MRDRNA2_390584_c0_seq1:200-613(+)